MKKIYKTFFLLIAMLLVANLFGQTSKADTLFMKKELSFLASDSLKGRAPGTKEDILAANFIYKELEKIGFMPLFPNKPLVMFDFTIAREVGKASYIKINNMDLKYNVDYVIPPFSGNGEVNAEFVSISGKNISEEIVSGKIVLLKSTTDSIKLLVTELADKRALAVIYSYPTNNKFVYSASEISSQVSLPVIYASYELFNKLTESPSNIIKLKTEIKTLKAKTSNVLMCLKTEGAVGTLLIGAHYDHLGMGGMGSGSMKPNVNQIHNGADDNASGVAASIQLAKILRDNIYKLRYNIIVAAFGAEERGLLGSKIVVDTLLKSGNQPTIMINLDMVGRMVDNKFQVGGSGTFAKADSLIQVVNKRHNLKLTVTKDGMGPSDHASFYNAGIPVLYFTTGVHQQYHTPDDKVSLINYGGMAKGVDFIADLISEVAGVSPAPQFVKTMSSSSTNKRASFKVTLGLIPDFTYEEGDGFRVGAITDGKPAQKAGMLEGDIITLMNDKKVSNIYDYMSRLGELKTGDTVSVVLKRNNKLIKLTIQL